VEEFFSAEFSSISEEAAAEMRTAVASHGRASVEFAPAAKTQEEKYRRTSAEPLAPVLGGAGQGPNRRRRPRNPIEAFPYPSTEVPRNDGTPTLREVWDSLQTEDSRAKAIAVLDAAADGAADLARTTGKGPDSQQRRRDAHEAQQTAALTAARVRQ